MPLRSLVVHVGMKVANTVETVLSPFYNQQVQKKKSAMIATFIHVYEAHKKT